MTTHSNPVPRPLSRRRLLRATGLAAGALAAASVTPPATRAAIAPATSSLHRYLGNYPKDRSTGWTEDVQGVAHDDANWFITQTAALWKFPVTHDLNASVAGSDPARGILRVGLPAALSTLRYDHFGDCDFIDYRDPAYPQRNGRYLFVPITGSPLKVGGQVIVPAPAPGIAVFRATDLRYLSMQTLSAQTEAGWCAINPATRMLWSSNSTLQVVERYRIDWAALAGGQLLLQRVQPLLALTDEQGQPLHLPHMQGGCFDPTGSRFYVMNGYYTDTDPKTAGIHVFDARTGRRIAKSTNGSGDFNYEFHPGWPDYEEPEGLTYWDLNDGRAPGIGGVLHALMLDNDVSSADEVYFKHYA